MLLAALIICDQNPLQYTMHHNLEVFSMDCDCILIVYVFCYSYAVLTVCCVTSLLFCIQLCW